MKKMGVIGSPLCERGSSTQTESFVSPIKVDNGDVFVEKNDEDENTGGSVPRSFFGSIKAALILGICSVLFFTFFCAFQLGNTKYLPISWPSDFGFPEPFSIFNYKEAKSHSMIW